MVENNQILNVTRESKFPMIDMSEAFAIIETQFINIHKNIIEIDILKAEDYIASEKVMSPLNIPLSPTSMMDGYAVSINEIDANENIEIISKNFAGEFKSEETKCIKNKCVYVTTGSIIPDWGDCVVQIENTEILKENHIKIKNLSHLTPGKFIRKVGCDIMKGDVLLTEDQKITVSDIALLVSCGVKNLNVYSKPRIGLLSTGNEVISIDIFSKNEEVSNYLTSNPGKIIDSNKEMIKLSLSRLNIPNIIDLGLIPDEYNKIKEKIEDSAQICDIIISSGGVSMGEKDLVKVFLEREGQIFFGRLNMKPGKPTTFAKFSNCFFFALPGNPVSCYVTYQLLITYALNLFQNNDHSQYPNVKAFLLHDTDMDSERPEYQRAM